MTIRWQTSVIERARKVGQALNWPLRDVIRRSVNRALGHYEAEIEEKLGDADLE